MITSPAFGKPSSRQWPLDSTSARSVKAAPASLTTDPEQLDRATVPAKVVGVAAEAAGGAPTSTVAVNVADRVPSGRRPTARQPPALSLQRRQGQQVASGI